jgi:hypothetical protein
LQGFFVAVTENLLRVAACAVSPKNNDKTVVFVCSALSAEAPGRQEEAISPSDIDARRPCGNFSRTLRVIR